MTSTIYTLKTASVETRSTNTNHVQWGRRSKAAWEAHLFSIIILALLPFWTYLNLTTLAYFEGSLSAALKELATKGPILFIFNYFPRPSISTMFSYGLWIAFQALLYTVVPGRKCLGQQTPGGHILEYTANGLMAWALSHAVYFGLAWWGVIDVAIIATQWEGLFVAANALGFMVGLLVFYKAHRVPSYPEDNKYSGSWAFDFAFGVELNPRIGGKWDIKYFFNGRPGLIAWTLIDISWAAYQYQNLGFITNSMSIVIILHTIYVVDFFWNEDWYTRTIDITYDHFGWILSWGDLALVPSFYTLQAQYLARHSTEHLDSIHAALVLATGFLGYALFRSANNQRDVVRRRQADVRIWGRKAEFIRCNYLTSDGVEHQSILLTSGWWGLVRHPNYLADMIQSFAMCATCGFHHLLPYSYFLYMTILLVFRALRDERKCRNKYGEKWDLYCELVPCQIIPGIY